MIYHLIQYTLTKTDGGLSRMDNPDKLATLGTQAGA
jgi:hypothetical protein